MDFTFMTQHRLCNATLADLSPSVRRPGYDRRQIGAGIVHLGLGAFARGHLAAYTEDVLELEPASWGIIGVSLVRPDQRDRLAPQDGLYTMLERADGGMRARIIGCVQQVLVAPENPAAVIGAMADAACRIVSLTITEKGYCHDPATGRLDRLHPDIRHDLAHPDAPSSAIGFIVAALRLRRAAGLPPFTALCCDNLPHNGAMLAGLVQDFAALSDPALAAWIAEHGAFPATMVDRIVPAATLEDGEAAAVATGLLDAAPVCHEPFRQWVIEDRFVDGMRPRWERVGAMLVADVAPYEHMKLRLLNGAHSALAYLGVLAGHATIAECAADPVLARYVEALWHAEIIPVVPAPDGVDLAAYADQLRQRFANTAIRHRTLQIAMDGSQKLPQRLLATLRERLARGLPIPALALAVAAWVQCLSGRDEAGFAVEISDPLKARLQAVLHQAGAAPGDQIRAVAGVTAVFGSDLASCDAFIRPVTEALTVLQQQGARAAALRLTPG